MRFIVQVPDETPYTGALMGDVKKYVSSWMGDTDPQVEAHPVHFPNVVVMDVSDGAFPSQPGAPAEDKLINM